MKRSMTATLAGEEIELVATFGAASEIEKKVGDPMAITREIFLSGMMEAGNVSYEPKWKYTIHNLPVIIHTGMKAGGDKRTLEQVQELVFDAGFYNVRDVANDYLALLVAPQAEEEMPGEAASGE